MDIENGTIPGSVLHSEKNKITTKTIKLRKKICENDYENSLFRIIIYFKLI